MPKEKEITTLPDIDPRELILDESRNGRRFVPKVEDMMVALLTQGQQSPIKVRPSPGNEGKLEVVFGFRRVKAAIAIMDQELFDGVFKLRYEVEDLDDKSAFISNLAENKDREGTTPIDNAYNYQRLKTEYGMEQKEIAKVLNVHPSTVSQTLKLLNLTAAEQKQVALFTTSGGKKGIATSTAYELAEMDPEERKEKLAELQGAAGTKRVTRSAVKKSKEDSGKGKQKGRTAKEIRITFEAEVTKLEAGTDMLPWQEFCQDFTRFCMGRVSGKSIINKLVALAGSK